MKNLSQKIKTSREQKNMTIEDLSKKTFLSVAVLKDLEAGKFDQYEGDETYVKMYLKKISDVLDLDSYELTQDYFALTQQIKIAQLKEKEELEKKQKDVVKKGKTFNFDSPQFTRKKTVYVNNSHEKVLRTLIVVILVILIFVAIWWGISKTKSNVDNPSFDPQNQTTIEGNIDLNDSNNNNSNDLNNNINDQSNNQINIGETIKFVRNKKLDFCFSVPSSTNEINFKMILGSDSWSSLKINGKDYKDFEAKIYKTGDIIEIKFKPEDFINFDLKNGYSIGHKYYLNDVEIPLIEEDYSEGVSHLILNMVNEDDITQ